MMQILVGLSDLGHVQHVEMLSALAPIQMIGLAQAREAFFSRVEVWEGPVCVFRSPGARTAEPLRKAAWPAG